MPVQLSGQQPQHLQRQLVRPVHVVEHHQQAHRDLHQAGFSQAEFGRVCQTVAAARARGRLAEHARALTRLAEEHIYGFCLQPTAVLAHTEAGDVGMARRLFAEWNLEHVLESAHWATDFMTVELGEVAARLGTPDADPLYQRLLRDQGMLSVLGTTMVCTGPVDLTLARLAARLGRLDAARRHLDQAGDRYQHLAGFGHAFDAARAAVHAAGAEAPARS